MSASHLVALAASVGAGMVLGHERERKGKSAGIRTFALVCLGSCLFTLIGREFNGAGDLARIIGQVISGVGFLGAGAVIHEGNKSYGLTTAAGIWVSAGLGVVFGLGYFPFGVLVVGVVYALFKLDFFFQRLLEGDCERAPVIITIAPGSARLGIIVREALENEATLTWTHTHSSDAGQRFDVQVCQKHPKHRSFLSDMARIEGVEIDLPRSV